MIEPERLAAFIASRICHDLVSPVSSVTSALELLDEPGEQDMKPQYEDLLREGARKAAATIQFLRYAFGSAGLNAGAADMHQFKKITEEYVAGLKPSVEWDITTDHLSYSHARVMMNMFMMAVDSLPRGGVIHARVRDEAGGMTITLTAKGPRAKLRDETSLAMQGGSPDGGWSPENVQPVFAKMISDNLGGEMTAKQQGEEAVVIMATGIRAAG